MRRSCGSQAYIFKDIRCVGLSLLNLMEDRCPSFLDEDCLTRQDVPDISKAELP